jgi:hypothetical protein
MWKPKSAS